MVIVDHSLHCRNRLFDWVMALATCLAAIVLAAPWFLDVVVVIGSVPIPKSLGITSDMLCVFAMVMGVSRAIALWRNGRWPWHGPIIRAMSAFVSAMIWGQLGLTSFYTNLSKGTISLGFAMFVAVTIGEMFSAYRAILDVRTPR